MKAWFGDQKLKDMVIARLREDRRLDRIVQGTYWEDGRGCHLGCLTRATEGHHEATERMFGIPIRVAYWLEAVFEGLPQDKCGWWVIAATEAIPVGADLSLAHHYLAAWLQGDDSPIAESNRHELVRHEIATMRSLHIRALNGDSVSDEEWYAAGSAAWSAVRSDRSAAGSAAWSAVRSAALSAALSAESAALSAGPPGPPGPPSPPPGRQSPKGASRYFSRRLSVHIPMKGKVIATMERLGLHDIYGKQIVTTKRELDVHIRWMIRRDMPEVLAIESQSFEFPWSEDDFIRCLRQRHCIGMVAEHDCRIAGFMIYEIHKTRLHLLTLAVSPIFRRMGVGRQMVERLASKLSLERRRRILTEIRESNLAAQLFFKSERFLCVRQFRYFYEDTDEDAYQFEYLF